MKKTNILLVLSFFLFIFSANAQNKNWKINEGFEDGVLPAGWLIVNSDYDGWDIYQDTSHAHTGDYCAVAVSNINGNDDWLITSQIATETGDKLIFYARSWFSTEEIEIMVSTTDNNINNFSLFQTATGITDSYSRYEYDLSSYNGENIYIAFRWTQNGYAVVLDDVQVGQTYEPTIVLPDNFTFEQNAQLIVDFSQYINVFNPEIATLTATGNTNVVVEIEGLNVTFTCPDWFGTETLTFEVDDGLGKASASDDVDVIVTEIAAFDVGMLSIEIPTEYSFTNDEVFPTFTIKNFGTADITDNIQLNCEIRDTLNILSYSALSTYSGGLLSGATYQASFAGAWTPDEIGTYSVKIWTHLTSDLNPENDSLIIETQVVQHYGTGGPDDMGYEWIDSQEEGGPVYNWIEISETGESAIMYETGVHFAGDDNLSAPIPFGFSFPFYGIDRDIFYVDTNGEMLLTDNNWYNHYPLIGWNYDGNMFNYLFPIPGNTYMPALVAVYWDDLLADEGVGDIYFQTFGDEPDRYCVVEWHDFRFCYGEVTDTTLCFEVIFHENGDMIFQYQDVAIGSTGALSPHDNGRGATIGIQNDNGDMGLSYLHEIIEGQTYIGVEPIGNLLTDKLAIKFFAGEDLYAPYIYYEDAIGNTFNNAPEISVQITDMSEILYDTLWYNTGSGWQALASSGKDLYTYTYQFPEIPNSTTVDYYFAAVDNSPAQNRGTLPVDAPDNYFTFKILPTYGVDILLATPGIIPGYMDYDSIEFNKYTAAFDAFGINYDIYNWDEYNQYRFPDSYKTIFVYGNYMGHGDSEDTLGLAVMEFLDMGTNENPKNIFTATDQLANNSYSIPNHRPLRKYFEAYIRGGYIHQTYPPIFGGSDGIGGPDIFGYSNGSIIGVAGSPVGTQNLELPVYSDTPDNIENGPCPSWYEDEVTNPEISSWESFLFEDGPHNGNAFSKGNACGIWLDNLIYKSFFISFDISQFTNDADINTMIEEALNWFGNTPTAGQTIDLSTGYRFISSRIETENPDMLVVLQEILNENLDFVRNSNAQMLRKIGPNWVNGIGDWIIDEGYLIKMFADDSFTIEGDAVDPATPIPVAAGFQFVSYFPETLMDALIAYETIIGDDLDFIRNSNGEMLRKIGPNWINGIGDGMPGEGYLVKMFADGEIIYPASAKSSSKTTEVPSHLIFKGGNPAEAVYTLYLEGLEIGDEVAAFDEDQMVGSTRINSQNTFENELPVFSTLINGQGYKEGNPIILKVWSENNTVSADFIMEAIYDSYVSDVYPGEDGKYSIVNITKGSIENKEETVSVFPNPSEEVFNILIEGVKGDIQIKVLGLIGKEYFDFKLHGNTSTQLDLTELATGVYFISFSGKDFNQVKKIVIQ